MRRSIVSFVFAGVLVGCSLSTAPERRGSEDVVVTPTKTVYASGERVTAQLSNRSSDEIGFGACSLRAERRVGSQWEIVDAGPVVCTMQLFLLGASDQRSLTAYDLLVSPGEYRLQFAYGTHGDHPESRVAYSAPFAVVTTGTQ